MIVKDFILQPGDGRETALKDIMLPKVEGMAIRFKGDVVRPTKTRFDFSFIDRCVDKMEKANKPFSLLPMSGDNTAQWLIDSLPSNEVLNGGPLPWSPRNIEYVVKYYEELGKKYNNHQLCKHIHIAGGTRASTSEEMHADSGWKKSDAPKIVDAYKDIIDAVAANFKTQTLWLAISGQAGAKGYVPPVIDYGIVKLGKRFGVKNNSLKWDTSMGATHNTLVVGAGKRGTQVGFEMAKQQTTKLSKAVANGITLATKAGAKEVIIFHYPPDLKYL